MRLDTSSTTEDPKKGKNRESLSFEGGKGKKSLWDGCKKKKRKLAS
jgi:hypothetical protein